MTIVHVKEDTARGAIGQPLDRVDGRLKVTGRATYAYEQEAPTPPAFGYFVEATVARGRIAGIDTAAAEAAPGVLRVITHRNAPDQRPFGEPDDAGRFSQSKAVLNSDRIRFHGDPVALVLAETFEAARAAAALVAVDYAPEAAEVVLEGHLDEAVECDCLDGGEAPDSAQGDFEHAFAQAPIKLDVTYGTPNQHHNAMEPHAALAVWQDERLTLYMSIQIVSSAREAIATTLKIGEDRVRIVSPFIGGGFGSKLGTQAEAVMAALGARAIGRPVKLAQSRRQMFANAPHRGTSVQRMRLGATEDGRLTAIAHETWQAMARHYPFGEPTASPTRASYAAANRLTRHRLLPLAIPATDSMRAPGEAIGSLVLESAMDELAAALDIDPIELRLRNEPETDPETRKPFASRRLVPCLREGAQRFGWHAAARRPATRREGRWLIGTGMAATIRPNTLQAADALVRLGANGHAVARLDMTDIGTGSYTVLTQIAAETLGLPVEQVSIELGDSDFPETPGSGGSFGAASAGSALYEACRALKRKVAEAACADPDSPLHGAEADAIEWDGSVLTADSRSEDLMGLLTRAFPDGIEAQGSIEPGDAHDDYAQYSYGAQFAEVAVSADSGEIRLRRMLGVFSAGRILNAKTARSQLMGGMIFGIGAAMMEESVLDPRTGAFVNRDLAEYHVPVNADVPAIEVVMLDEPDEKSNPLGSKGLGELGVCGAGAAIANAVFNATGVRVRDFPITLDKLLPHLPPI